MSEADTAILQRFAEVREELKDRGHDPASIDNAGQYFFSGMLLAAAGPKKWGQMQRAIRQGVFEDWCEFQKSLED